MKRYITASKYTEYATARAGETRYSVHYSEVTNEMSSLDAFRTFRAQISKIAPYDDAQYYWAKLENGKVEYIQNGKVKDTSSYGTSDDADLDNIEWVQSITEDVCYELNELNKNIEPIMIHN